MKFVTWMDCGWILFASPLLLMPWLSYLISFRYFSIFVWIKKWLRLHQKSPPCQGQCHGRGDCEVHEGSAGAQLDAFRGNPNVANFGKISIWKIPWLSAVIRGYSLSMMILAYSSWILIIYFTDFYCTCSHPFGGASSRAWSATAGRAEGHCRRRAEGAEGDSHCIHPSTFLPGGRWPLGTVVKSSEDFLTCSWNGFRMLKTGRVSEFGPIMISSIRFFCGFPIQSWLSGCWIWTCTL